MTKEELIKKIFGDNPYEWDEYTIMSTEFVDHVGDVLDNYTIKKKGNCKKCEYLMDLFERIKNPTNRDYWVMTEIFMFMHGNKDFCDETKKVIKYFNSELKEGTKEYNKFMGGNL